MAFRQYEGGEQKYEDGFLRLTVTDARELVTALEFLIATAGEALIRAQEPPPASRVAGGGLHSRARGGGRRASASTNDSYADERGS